MDINDNLYANIASMNKKINKIEEKITKNNNELEFLYKCLEDIIFEYHKLCIKLYNDSSQ